MSVLSAKLSEVVAKSEELGKTVATLTADLTTARAEIDTHKASVAALTTERDNLKASIETASKAHSEALVAVTGERDTFKAEVEKAQKILANPAFKDAQASGHSGTIPSGVAAEGGDTRESLVKQLEQIKEPAARQSFWRKHFGGAK